MTPKNILPRTKIADFIDNLYDGDLHAKRVLSLANATLGGEDLELTSSTTSN